jgi:hypothetical protein
MSGGGVWKVLNFGELPIELALVGVVIEHHKHQWGAMIGVRINGIMECIRETHPELDGLIPTSSTMDVLLRNTDE